MTRSYLVTLALREGDIRRHGSQVPHGRVRRHSTAVQVEPIKPMLEAPGTKCLKLKYGELLSMLLQLCFQIQVAPLQPGVYVEPRAHLAADVRRGRVVGADGRRCAPIRHARADAVAPDAQRRQG